MSRFPVSVCFLSFPVPSARPLFLFVDFPLPLRSLGATAAPRYM